MTNQFLVAVNFKANLTVSTAESWLEEFGGRSEAPNVKVVLAPPYPLLELFRNHREKGNFTLGTQDLSRFSEGSYTGEVPASTLVTLGVQYSFIGHSERRKLLGETPGVVAEKITRAFEAAITPIIGVQNTLELPTEQVKRGGQPVVLMFEPFEAISKPGDFHPVESEKISEQVKLLKTAGNQETQVIYGGSVTSQNIESILDTGNLDGICVGRAALEVSELIKIIQVCQHKRTSS